MINYSISILNSDEYDFGNSFYTKPAELNPKATDFAVLLGALADEDGNCCWWCRHNDTDFVYIENGTPVEGFDEDGCLDTLFVNDFTIATRPAIMHYINQKKYIVTYKTTDNGTMSEFAFGEYPQTVETNKNIYRELESLYQAGKLPSTGKTYTTDSPYYDKNGFYAERTEFKPYEHVEFKYGIYKYVRVEFGGYTFSCLDRFENIKDLTNNSVYWVRVEPIWWHIKEGESFAIADKALLGGVKYHYEKYNGLNTIKAFLEFNETSLSNFLCDYFSKDIIPYNLSFDNYSDMSYNELISQKFK